MSLRIGIDTGGTFTDFVLFDGAGVRVHKVRSTPADPSVAILEGLRDLSRAGTVPPGGGPSGAASTSRAGADTASVAGADRGGARRDIVHGSTVATNALLERKGARVGLVTTEGFEDVLLIGRQTRRELYNPFVEAPRPIVPADKAFGLRERVLTDGVVERALEESDLEGLVERLRGSDVEAVAVCLLHAYANPVHERAVAARLAREGYPVSVSHELLSEYREFERCSTTAVNAYVTPLMASYLERLEAQLAGDPLRIMQSNGGTISAASARRAAVQTVLSGPAGGVVGAAAMAAAAGFPRVITFDMGGTSTDVSLVDHVPARTTEAVVGEFPILLPLLDIHTVGAGGGSIAYLDAGGALRVGPESAGADPGPACYGKGDQPTVTDANLLLGRIDPDRFLGGRMRIDPARARRVLTELAGRAGLDVMALAEGIVRVANANMERAIRVVSVERGFDPRDFALVPFGGAGGLHACAIAAALDIRTILVPAHPGVLSALGMVLSDAACDFSHTLLVGVEQLKAGVLEAEVETLGRRARARLHTDGFGDETIRLEASVDLRYVGQAYEITVPVAVADQLVGGADGHEDESCDGRSWAFIPAFHAAHERMYGYADPKRPVELVNVRVRGIGLTRKPDLVNLGPRPRSGRPAAGGLDAAAPREPAPGGGGAPAPLGPGVIRSVGERLLCVRGALRPAPVFDRGALVSGDVFAGPALVVDEGSTTLVPERWAARLDAARNLILTAAGGPQAG